MILLHSMPDRAIELYLSDRERAWTLLYMHRESGIRSAVLGSGIQALARALEDLWFAEVAYKADSSDERFLL